MKTIVLTAAAAKDLDGLPTGDRERVADALCRYALTGIGDVKRLTGRAVSRMRIGAYRVIFAANQTTMPAIYVGRRATTTYRRQ